METSGQTEPTESWSDWYTHFCSTMAPSTDQLEVITKHLIALCVIKNGFDVGDEDVMTEVAQRLQFDLGIAKLLEQGLINWRRNNEGEIVFKGIGLKA